MKPNNEVHVVTITVAVTLLKGGGKGHWLKSHQGAFEWALLLLAIILQRKLELIGN